MAIQKFCRLGGQSFTGRERKRKGQHLQDAIDAGSRQIACLLGQR